MNLIKIINVILVIAVLILIIVIKKLVAYSHIMMVIMDDIDNYLFNNSLGFETYQTFNYEEFYNWATNKVERYMDTEKLWSVYGILRDRDSSS